MSEIQNVTDLWKGGSNSRYSLVCITPNELAEAYKLDKPCRVQLIGMPDLGGILIKFLGPSNKRKKKDK
jgi:hypothetical protein